MSLNLDLEKNILQNSKIPKWLRARGIDFSTRPRAVEALNKKLEVCGGEADARDMVSDKPPQNMKAYKKAKKRIEEAEELHKWIQKKQEKEDLDDYIDGLESAFNSMS